MTTPPPQDPAPREDRGDLGFGRVAAQQAQERLLRRDGTPNSRKYGLGSQRGARAVLAAMRASWPTYLAWSAGGLLLVAGLFALGFTALGPTAIAGSEALELADPFFRAFVYSVGLLTTVGTGPLHAVGPEAAWLTILGSVTGVVLLVGAGGILVARLIRPQPSIRFSDSAVIAPHRGGRAWMFRMINTLPSELIDVSVRVNLAWFETVDGARVRRFHQLRLERSRIEFFTLHWTLVHAIDGESPLRGLTPERLRESEAEFVLLVTGLEETFSTSVHARTSYRWDEIRWDAKFADMFVPTTDGITTVDAERLDRLDRLPEGTTRTPAFLELADVVRA